MGQTNRPLIKEDRLTGDWEEAKRKDYAIDFCLSSSIDGFSLGSLTVEASLSSEYHAMDFDTTNTLPEQITIVFEDADCSDDSDGDDDNDDDDDDDSLEAEAGAGVGAGNANSGVVDDGEAGAMRANRGASEPDGKWVRANKAGETCSGVEALLPNSGLKVR